jgi:hypothetical protein
MSESETYEAEREARSDVAKRPHGPTRHERALLTYLGGLEYVEERRHEREGAGTDHEGTATGEHTET